MKQLVIFDLDGTLINTIADLAQSTNHALQALGYPTHEQDTYKFRVGNGINKLFERALPEGEKTAENVLRVRKEFIPYYNVHNTDLSRPYPGMEALLAFLQQQGIQMAVASNKYQEATSKIIPYYVGDSGVDMQTGRNAGVETCGVTWGFRPRTELEQFAPQHIVDTAEQLKAIILS